MDAGVIRVSEDTHRVKVWFTDQEGKMFSEVTIDYQEVEEDGSGEESGSGDSEQRC